MRNSDTQMLPAKILAVDDDRKLLELLQKQLSSFNYRVILAQDGHTALKLARIEEPDLVVLDVNLPGVDGLQVCQKLRATSDIPILMLSALREDYDRIVGLEIGADDYLGKPCNPRELLARVRALLRRSRMNSRAEAKNTEDILEIGTLRLDVSRHEAWQSNAAFPLTPIEFALLELLMREHQKAVSRERLIIKIWGSDFVGSTRIVDTHVRNLRRKLESSSPKIEAVRGIGFKLV